MELLCAAQVRGQLTAESFEQWLAAVQGAQSDSAIQALLADLWDYEAEAGGYSDLQTIPGHSLAQFPERERLSAVATTTVRAGNWVVPWHLELLAVLGELKLDFREAYLPDDVIDVDVSVCLAQVRLIVPPGTTIQNDVTSFMGTNDIKLRRRGNWSSPSGLLLRVTGNVYCGSLEIREH